MNMKIDHRPEGGIINEATTCRDLVTPKIKESGLDTRRSETAISVFLQMYALFSPAVKSIVENRKNGLFIILISRFS